MHYSELTNWRRANWQTGGGAKSALVPSRNQLHKFWQAYPGATLPLIPTMYDTWGGTSRILGARGLRKKLSPVEGFRPPTHYVVWVGEPDYLGAGVSGCNDDIVTDVNMNILMYGTLGFTWITWSVKYVMVRLFSACWWITRGVRDVWHILNTDEFSEKFWRGGWVIFNPNISFADFCHYRWYFGHEFRKKIAIWFSENEGGEGQRSFGTFPKIHPFWKGKASLSSIFNFLIPDLLPL